MNKWEALAIGAVVALLAIFAHEETQADLARIAAGQCKTAIEGRWEWRACPPIVPPAHQVAAVETVDVSSALIADRTVDASRIAVDTFHQQKVVILKGSVPVDAQRATASQIAAAEAPGYTILNLLTVKD